MGFYTLMIEGNFQVGRRFEIHELDGCFTRLEPRITALRGDADLVSEFLKKSPDALVWRRYESSGKIISEKDFFT